MKQGLSYTTDIAMTEYAKTPGEKSLFYPIPFYKLILQIFDRGLCYR